MDIQKILPKATVNDFAARSAARAAARPSWRGGFMPRWRLLEGARTLMDSIVCPANRLSFDLTYSGLYSFVARQIWDGKAELTGDSHGQ